MHVCVYLVPRIADISPHLQWHVQCLPRRRGRLGQFGQMITFPQSCFLSPKCIESSGGSKVLKHSRDELCGDIECAYPDLSRAQISVQTFPVGPADHIYVLFLSLNISDRWSLMSLTMPWMLLQLGNTMGAHLVKMLACGQQMHASIMFLSWGLLTKS